MNAEQHGRDTSGETFRERLEREAAELDGLAPAPTDFLERRVGAYGRCLWEITSGEPPLGEISGTDPDRELAARLCAGCPVRRECLELELRTAGEPTVGVWGGLDEDDRRVLHTVWRARAIRTGHPDDEQHQYDAEQDEQHDGQEGEQS